MPWSNDNGPKASGPWGGGGGGGRGSGGNGGGPWGGGGGGRGPNGSGGGGGGGQGPNIDDFFKKGQNQLKGMLGEGGGGGGVGFLLVLLIAAGAWLYASFYTVRPQEQAVVLTFGEYTATQGPGLNFAPWPVQTATIVPVTRENVIQIGTDRSSARSTVRDPGVMLTGDANIIDINFQVVWNISDLRSFLYNLADPPATIQAVAESAMREVVGRSNLAPLLNRDRAQVEADVLQVIQTTLDEYEAGVSVLRVTMDRADPPAEVINAFRDVQAAEQERDTKEKQAQARFNEITAQARGEAAQLLEDAEAYRARVVSGAEGEAARFVAVLNEYTVAKDVTRKRLYLETMERVFGNMNKVIIDDASAGAQGVVPYLPLDQLRGRTAQANQ
ncbi:MAG: FtsH protease activity modulator HflK [Pseudomonadota bacterium]